MLNDEQVYRLARYIAMDSRVGFLVQSKRLGPNDLRLYPACFTEVVPHMEQRIQFMMGKFTAEEAGK